MMDSSRHFDEYKIVIINNHVPKYRYITADERLESKEVGLMRVSTNDPSSSTSPGPWRAKSPNEND